MGRNFRAEIKENSPVNENHFLLTLAPLEETPRPKPGQFYMVGCREGSGIPATPSTGGGTAPYDPLLKRPFSVFSELDGSIRILYRVKGKGTSMLKERKRGEVIDIIGPLGNSYPIPKKESALIVAGGIGIASLLPLIERLKTKAHVVYGARSAGEFLMLDEIRAHAGELALCTDDGSYREKDGHKGTVLSLLRDISFEGKVVYSCGPPAMLKALSELSVEKGFKGYVSLEERMACGLGACLGCAVKTIHGYKRVCKEGPVFKMGEVVWET